MIRDFNRQYDEFNRSYFGGELPKVPVVCKEIDGNYMGYFHRWPNPNDQVEGVDGAIYLSESMRGWDKICLTTLLHEMVHVKLRNLPCETSKRGNPHGRLFKREMRRLVRAGAFDELW